MNYKCKCVLESAARLYNQLARAPPVVLGRFSYVHVKITCGPQPGCQGHPGASAVCRCPWAPRPGDNGPFKSACSRLVLFGKAAHSVPLTLPLWKFYPHTIEDAPLEKMPASFPIRPNATAPSPAARLPGGLCGVQQGQLRLQPQAAPCACMMRLIAKVPLQLHLPSCAGRAYRPNCQLGFHGLRGPRRLRKTAA